MRHLRGYQLRLLYTCISFGSIFISFSILSQINGRQQRPDFDWDLIKENEPKSFHRTGNAQDTSLEFDPDYKPEEGIDLDATKNDIPPEQFDVGPGYGKPKPTEADVIDYRPSDREQELMDMEQTVYQLFPNDTKSVECPRNVSINDYYKEYVGLSFPMNDNWDKFFSKITSCKMFQNYGDAGDLLNDMANMRVKEFAFMEGGTQIKLLATFKNGKRALLKPMRYSRAYETDPNQFYFSEMEKHNAEIATFHLDRVLGFHRSIPTVGRVFDLRKVNRSATQNVREHFYWSPGQNLCFTSDCKYFCDSLTPVCGKPFLKEFSVQAYLPTEEHVPRDHLKSPYRRTYSRTKHISAFQVDDRYCELEVLTDPDFMKSKTRLLDLIDTHVLDFLARNQDRHHLQSLTIFDGMPGIPKIYNLFMDNGRGFGIHSSEDMDILLPLTQCCLIRPSTLKMLLKYYSGPVSLSKAFQLAMLDDPTYPVLIPAYYQAIERRLQIILIEILKCIKNKGAKNVIVTLAQKSKTAKNPKNVGGGINLRFVDGEWEETPV